MTEVAGRVLIPAPRETSVRSSRTPEAARPGPAELTRLVVALGAVTLLTIGVYAIVRVHGTSDFSHGRWAGVVIGALFALYLVGAWSVSGLRLRWARWLILGGATATQIVAFTTAPRFSDDLYRYVWDGRVQAAGIDPYRYVPVATRLVGLRAGSGLFPPTGRGLDPSHCVTSAPGITAGCTLLNRPLVHTIYPPVAEAYYFLAHWWGPRGIQISAAVLAIGVTFLLLAGLPRIGVDARNAVLWAWCPTVAIEAGNGGHADVLAVLFTACGLLALASKRVGRGGVFLGLGIAAKVTPALAVPAALRRRPLLLLGSVVGVVVGVYLPHVLAVGSGVEGFFGGYLDEEGYQSGSRFALLDSVMPTSLVKPAAVAVLAVTALLVWRLSDPERPWHGALAMTGVGFLVTAPPFAWYAELLVLFVAFAGWRSVAWVGVAYAGYMVQLGGTAFQGYGSALVAVAAVYAGQLAFKTLRRRSATKRRETTVAADSADSVDHAAGLVLDSLGPTDVILPCLDEAEALPYVLSRIPAGYRAIVVDNGSTDGSAEVAAALGALVVHEPRRGFGAACHAGLLAATADVVCFLDCDGSFDPEDLPKVADAVRAGQADLALGQRRPLTRDAWPPHARLANRLLARRIRSETGVRIRDLGPMRAARREELLALGIEDRRFGYPLEMVLKAAREGWRIAETDVPYAPRTGKSKVTGTVGGTVKAVRDMRRVWRAATR
ncbi:glycosyltransferase family 2 protein [Catenulispora sp. NF23]|nr:glycosyltransferase family 2 protein [Catenulispora pinistramenti]MBS2533281.1 glycosyltransferase family 2 protein [Catenulispora pinistramenti]